MVQIYYNLIKKGLKSIDEVPDKWKAQVQELLNKDKGGE